MPVQRHFQHGGVPELKKILITYLPVVTIFATVCQIGQRFRQKKVLFVIAHYRDKMQPVFTGIGPDKDNGRIPAADFPFQGIQIPGAVHGIQALTGQKLFYAPRVHGSISAFARHFPVQRLARCLPSIMPQHEGAGIGRAFHALLKVDSIGMRDQKTGRIASLYETGVQKPHQQTVYHCGGDERI